MTAFGDRDERDGSRRNGRAASKSRLLELQQLRDRGLVTYEDYEQGRAAILDSL